MIGRHPSDRLDEHTIERILEERERLARDLHDGVVQEIFATSLALAAMSPMLPAELHRRVEAIIDAQDRIVQRLRATVFALKPPVGDERTARAVIADVLAEAERGLGFAPSLVVAGPVDDIVVGPLLEHVEFAVREAVSNAARHAGATRIVVTLRADRECVEVTVSDDGVGPGAAVATGRGDGLRNLDRRAAWFGGSCRLTTGRQGGAELRWRVPTTGSGTGVRALPRDKWPCRPTADHGILSV